MSTYDQAYAAAKRLIDREQFPSPTAMNRELGNTRRRKQNHLNGPEAKARAVALQEAGYFKDLGTGRWRK